jgi:hypothetical protein
MDCRVAHAPRNDNTARLKKETIIMLKNLFDFSKRRTGKDAVIFYVFYVGCFVLLTIALGGDV